MTAGGHAVVMLRRLTAVISTWTLPVGAMVLVLVGLVAGNYVMTPSGVASQLTRRQTCTTPSGEARLLAAYPREPALATPPISAQPPPRPVDSGSLHYCERVGVDRPTFAHITEVWSGYDATGWWPADRLRARYEREAVAGGWAYVRQGDQIPGVSCFGLLHGGTPYCEGNGVVYCRAFQGVTTFLEISDMSYQVLPHTYEGTTINLQVEARWELAACPPPGTPPSARPTA